MVVVIATVRARAGWELEMEGVLRSLVPTTQKEAGCIQYDLHTEISDPASFAFYERWSDQAALDRHLLSPHMSAALPRIGALAEGTPSIVIYRLTQ